MPASPRPGLSRRSGERTRALTGDIRALILTHAHFDHIGIAERIVARAATADTERAMASLDALAETGAQTVLTGHGEPRRDGADAIAEHARGAPVA